MRRVFSMILGVCTLLLLIGTVVFAIAAQMTDPPLEPALTFMRWQALWDDGRYGVKYTFAITWICTLFALLGPFGLVAMTLGALRQASKRPSMPPWPPLEWKRMGEGSRAALGILLTTTGLLFAWYCLSDPAIFIPVGFLARVTLILAPFALLGGLFLLLDVALPASVLRGSITAIEQVPGATPQQSAQHFVTLGDQRLELPAALWHQLKAGDAVALRRSGGFDRVLEFARE